MKRAFVGLLLVAAGVLTLSSCDKKVSGCMDPESTNYNAEATEDDGSCAYPTYSVGQSIGGGVVAYVLQSGDPGYDANRQHGLIAAPYSSLIILVWSSEGSGNLTSVGNTSAEIGTGGTNTDNIVSHIGTGSYGAKNCSDLTLGGYSDWFLPSKNELNKIYLNKSVLGGFENAYYWSSSEISSQAAWAQQFGNGTRIQGTKTNTYYVLPVRAY